MIRNIILFTFLGMTGLNAMDPANYANLGVRAGDDLNRAALESRKAKLDVEHQKRKAEETRNAKLQIRTAMLERAKSAGHDSTVNELQLQFDLEDAVETGDTRSKWLYDNQHNVIVGADQFITRVNHAVCFSTFESTPLPLETRDLWKKTQEDLRELTNSRFVSSSMKSSATTLLERMNAFAKNVWYAYLLGLTEKPSEKEYWQASGLSNESIMRIESARTELAQLQAHRVKAEQLPEEMGRRNADDGARGKNYGWFSAGKTALLMVTLLGVYGFYTWNKNRRMNV